MRLVFAQDDICSGLLGRPQIQSSSFHSTCEHLWVPHPTPVPGPSVCDGSRVLHLTLGSETFTSLPKIQPASPHWCSEALGLGMKQKIGDIKYALVSSSVTQGRSHYPPLQVSLGAKGPIHAKPREQSLEQHVFHGHWSLSLAATSPSQTSVTKSK